MPRISALTSLTTADNADELPIVDVSASVTKKITRGDLLKAPLPTNSVTSAAITDGSVTSSKINLSGSALAYVPKTTAFSTSSTTAVQVTDLTATVTLTGSERLRITAFTPDNSVNALQNHYFQIWEGTVGSGTVIQSTQTTSGGTNYHTPINCSVIRTPTAGSKTYNVAFFVGGGTGTVNATTTAPAYLLIERI